MFQRIIQALRGRSGNELDPAAADRDRAARARYEAERRRRTGAVTDTTAAEPDPVSGWVWDDGRGCWTSPRTGRAYDMAGNPVD